MAQDKIVIDESQLYFDIRITRMYFSELHPFTKTDVKIANKTFYGNESLEDEQHIEVDYDLTPAYTSRHEKDTRIEKIFGTIVFGPNDKEKRVLFKIFKRQYYESNFDFNRFNFNLRFAQKGGQIKHNGKTIEIEYYDGDPTTTEMNDAFWSYALFNDATKNDEAISNKIGKWYSFTFYSYYAKDMQKNNSNDVYYLRLVKYFPQNDTYAQQEQPFRSYYVGDAANDKNKYQINYMVKKMEVQQIRVYAACKGFRVRYFANHEDIDKIPVLDRIEPFLPGRFDL